MTQQPSLRANSHENKPMPIPVQIRRATALDLPAVVRLLADDPLGATREQYAEPLPTVYQTAFAAMEAQTGNALLVAMIDGAVVGRKLRARATHHRRYAHGCETFL
jgi:hypothetical protein